MRINVEEELSSHRGGHSRENSRPHPRPEPQSQERQALCPRRVRQDARGARSVREYRAQYLLK